MPRESRSRLAALPGTFLASTIVLAIGAAAAALAVRSERVDWQWVLHTREVLERLERTRSEVREAQIEQRDFVLTRDPLHLARFEAVAATTLSEVAEIRRLTEDNEVQQRAVARLQGSVAELLGALRANASSVTDAVAIVRDEQRIAAVRAELEQMRNEEQRLLAVRTRDADQARVVTVLAVAGLGVLTLLLMAYIRRVVARDTARIELLAAQRHMALDAARMGWWHTDMRTRLWEIDERFQEIFGIRTSPVPSDEIIDLIHDEDRPRVSAALEASIDPARRAAFQVEYRISHRDGRARWIEARGQAQFAGKAASAHPMSLVGTVSDITERKAADAALVESEERFRLLADNMSQLAWIAEANGDITWYNKRWFDYTGSTLAEMRGTGWTKMQHPDHLQGVVERFRRSIETGEPWEDTFPLRGRDGRYRWFLSRAVPIHDAEGRIDRWFGTNTDITPQREAEAALAELNRSLERRVQARTRALEEANAEMEAFTYSVSHDLRAPLRGIHGYAQALEEDFDAELPAEGHAYLERIASAAARMEDLIQDLLAYSRVAREDLQLAPVDLAPVVDAALQALKSQIAESGAEVTVERPLPCVIATRAVLLQIVQNLVGNAIKFVAPGATPRVKIAAREDDQRVRVTVEDNGIGIEPRHRERIFRVFERLHGADVYPGTGVGLAIVRKGIERMGGTTGVDASPDGGSRFWFELPAAAAPST